MKKTLIAIASAVMTVSASYAQVLVAGWDFQTTTTGGTAVAASPATPKIYTANFGAGTLYFDGSNGSSNWFVPVAGSSSTELTASTGSNVNRLASDGTLLSQERTGTSALAVVGGAGGTAANGKSAVFAFSMAGKEDLSISLSARRTGTGFSTQLWQYSADGGNTWGNIGSFIGGTTAGTIQDSFAKSGILSFGPFGPLSALDGVSDARLRVTFTGASTTTGYNLLDNIQLNAVPEPSSGALLVLGGVSLVAIRSLRKKNS
jgi:hypothetical protein